ncbi:MAG: YihY/virulence factor BrkB family protein [Chloroflexi bacterium]|nr:YihY/virulence factor BrkB family protein [Chloroflexota bacterium]
MNMLLDRFYRTPVGRFAAAWGELRAGEGAVLIAWQLLFSLLPLVVGLLAIVGLVLRNPDRLAALASTISQQFPEQASDLVGFITETREFGGVIGVISVLGLLWSGSNLFGVMGAVFNRFYGVEDRTFVAQKLVAFIMMAVYTVLVSVSVASTSLTGVVIGLSENVLPFRIPAFAFLLGWLISLGSAVLMFLVLYRVVPNARMRLWNVWRGAVLAGLLFVALTQIFPIYLRFLGGGFAAYKALGVFLLLMTWFYFLGMILCLGALVNALNSGLCPAPSKPKREAEAAAAQVMARQAEADSGGPVKVLVWTGLTAATTSVVLLLTRRLAVLLWRGMTRQDPPSTV